MERVALVGRSGTGKSSVISYVFRLGSEFAPIVIPVANEREEVATDPGAFARHAAQVLLRYADETELTGADERERFLRAVAEKRILPSKERGITAGMKLAPWIASVGIQGDLKRAYPAVEVERSASEVLAALDHMIEIVKRTDLIPVLVIDDSDRWLNLAEDTPRADIVTPFMTRVLRMLMERAIGLVVAIHEAYSELPEYGESIRGGILDTEIDVPPLSSSGALEAVLEHRVRVHVPDARLDLVLSREGVAALWEIYERKCARNMRKTLQVAHGALAEADLQTITEPIGPELIQSSAVATLEG